MIENMFSYKHKPIKYGFDQSNPPSTDSVAAQIPAGQTVKFLPSSDNALWLFSRSWEPSEIDTTVWSPQQNNTKATLIICHGTVDHSGVYDELAKELNKVGIAVFAFDMRGWGLSDGESMYMNDIETFVEDVDMYYEDIHKKPAYVNVKNRFILGKSIGGLIAAHTVLEHPHKYSGLLGLSGAYKPHPDHAVNPVLEKLLWTLNACIPKLPLKQIFDPKLIVKDEDALKKWYSDPLCSKAKIRVGYAVEALRCRKELPDLVCELNLPMLMMIGEDDHVVSRDGLEMMLNCKRDKNFDYYLMAPHSQSQVKTYEGGRHNLLAEPGLKDKVIGDIKEWILHRVWCEGKDGEHVAQ